MTLGFVDTSCLVAVALGESGSDALVARFGRLERLFASNLLEAELRATLRREGVEHDEALLAEIAWVLPDRPLTAEIAAVLDAGQLRGADGWHLACALYLAPEPRELEFLTLDTRQAAVAATLGFPGGDLTAAAR
jgi:predicted nucleic acid-binding protein